MLFSLANIVIIHILFIQKPKKKKKNFEKKKE